MHKEDINPVNVIATSNYKDPKFTKEYTPDGNILYTIQYQGAVQTKTPELTKLLLNTNNEILAYIDIKHILPPFTYVSMKPWDWYGIQEWHPQLIGEFRHIIQDKEGEPFFHDVWIYNPKEDLYTLATSSISSHNDWYRLDNNTITTNYGSGITATTRTYKYNTHPLAPTPKIELLTKFILYKDGVITKKQFNKYTRERKKQWHHDARKQKFQNVKRNIGKVLTRAFTDEKA